MIIYDEAAGRVRTYLRELSATMSTEPVLLEDRTMERPYGWVFFYDSQAYVESGDFRQMLVGNAPVLVLKRNGEIRVLGTANPVESYLESYERTDM